MVKADVRRDYYADLELKSSADTEEIKKQFRKLGAYLLDGMIDVEMLTIMCPSSQVSP
jgi:hypothetical protein